MRRGTWIVAFTAAVGLALSLIGQAWAQYPPPAGSVVLAAEDATPGLGAEVAVTATVLDAGGLPAAGVACTFRIAQQPGSDASVNPAAPNARVSVVIAFDTGSSTAVPIDGGSAANDPGAGGAPVVAGELPDVPFP